MKKNKSILFIIAYFMLIIEVKTQTITNVNATQNQNEIIITYDLDAPNNTQNFDITLEVYQNNKLFFTPKAITGGIGNNIKKGNNKKITWEVTKDIDIMKDDNFVFKIKAKYQEIKKQDNNDTEIIEGVTFKMIEVEGGTFTIGCTPEQGSDCYDNEKKTKQITLTSYQIGETEVTQALWKAVMGKYPDELYNKNCDECPVERVSYEDIVNDFLPKLNRLTKKNYRLPTEAEWEYAARGGNKASKQTKYAGSNNIEEVAWYSSNYQKSKHGTVGSTHPVAQLKANALGLYDMSGNVYEWCNDWYVDSYDKYPSSSGAGRVIRGGAWGLTARYARVAHRYYGTPSYKADNVGFRLCRADR